MKNSSCVCGGPTEETRIVLRAELIDDLRVILGIVLKWLSVLNETSPGASGGGLRLLKGGLSGFNARKKIVK